MARPEPASLDDSLYSIDNNGVPTLSHSFSALDLSKSHHAVFVQPKQRPSRKAYHTLGSSSSIAPEPNPTTLTSHPQGQEIAQQCVTPEVSPEHTSRKRQVSNAKSGHDIIQAPLTPPASDDEEDTPSRTTGSESDHSLEFPLNRQLLSASHHASMAIRKDRRRPPSRRAFSAGAKFLTSKHSTDRFMAHRDSAHDLSQTYRASKATQDLTPPEKLVRNSIASPDPFGPLVVPRLRAERANNVRGRTGPSQNPRTRTHTIGALNTILLPQDSSAPQNRQASAGAVWNVGGNTHAAPAGPVRAVSNGRGGFYSSGSNAPMYIADFFDEYTAERETETMENRVAAALDIDRTSRLVSITRSPTEMRSVSTGSIGMKRKRDSIGHQTRWVNGEWVRSCISLLDAPMLRDDYYCTVLAYCYTSRTLAVGLANRVYLWSEEFGVKYPPDDPTNRPSTYVTSISFSSREGGRSILAIGRNSGQICLWSLDDDEDVRFKAQQPCSIACVAFKPVTTGRPSERFGSIAKTEELLVGDEAGDVYYYSIEWMTRNQIDIHGWIGNMKLLAKISMHSQQICGLAWSPTGDYFATGANDNACCLFEVREVLRQPTPLPETLAFYRKPLQTLIDGLGIPGYPAPVSQTQILTPLGDAIVPGHPMYQSPTNITGAVAILDRARIIPREDGSTLVGDGRQKHKWIHSAAVKAIAFCPWQRGLIATGGGSNDRAIHFYHISSGACLATINVHAQVTSLIWSSTRREIAATFGYAQPEHSYRIAVFSWPECKQVVAIPWASDMRALLAIPYPRGPGETRCHTRLGETWYSRTAEEGCLVVACSDESVKFHEVWSGASKAIGSHSGLLGGSKILGDFEGLEGDGGEVIR